MGLIQQTSSATSITKTVTPGLLQKVTDITPMKDTTGVPLTVTDVTDINKPPVFPIAAYQFAIEIGTSRVALFQSVTGLAVTREAIKIPVGGENDFSREFPGHVSFGRITFGVGLTSSKFFWSWMTAGSLDGYALKKDFTLIQRNVNTDPKKTDTFTEIKHWNFKNAFPVSWKLSNLSIDDTSGIVIESLELSFEKFELGQ